MYNWVKRIKCIKFYSFFFLFFWLIDQKMSISSEKPKKKIFIDDIRLIKRHETKSY